MRTIPGILPIEVGLFHQLFVTNPLPYLVNVSLWTIPWEVGCSIALLPLLIFPRFFRPSVILAIAIGLSICIPIGAVVTHHEMNMFMSPQGHMLVLFFLAGACFYVFRYSIPINVLAFAIAAAVTFILFSKAKPGYLAPVFVAYVTIYLGRLHPPKFGLMKNADFSYGMYLYGFPMEQIMAYSFPEHRTWLFNFSVALVASLLMAMASWYCIEGPVLKRKKQIYSSIGTLTSAVISGRRVGVTDEGGDRTWQPTTEAHRRGRH